MDAIPQRNVPLVFETCFSQIVRMFYRIQAHLTCKTCMSDIQLSVDVTLAQVMHALHGWYDDW